MMLLSYDPGYQSIVKDLKQSTKQRFASLHFSHPSAEMETSPVISDLTMEVSKAFGMLQPAASTTQAVRAVFMMDPTAVVRAILYYPLANARNVNEIMRMLTAVELSDQHKVATPANWQPGDDVIVPPPGSCGTAKERVERPAADPKVLDWFMVLKKCLK